MAKCKRRGQLRNVQKKPVLRVCDFSGAGWFGQVYEIARGKWSWAASVDMGDRILAFGGMGFSDFDDAVAALKMSIISESVAAGRINF